MSASRANRPRARHLPRRRRAASQANRGRVSKWFVPLIHPEQTTVGVPIAVNGRSLGSLVITSHPTDEIAEIWDGIVTQLEIGSAIAAALLLITLVVVNRALQPLTRLCD